MRYRSTVGSPPGGRGPIPRTVSESSSSSSASEPSDCDEETFFDARQEEEQANDSNSTGDTSNCNSNGSTCNKTSIPFHSRLGHRIDFLQLTAPQKKTHLQRTLAYQLFGDRLVMYKLDVTKSQGAMPLTYTEESNGYVYRVLCSKFETKHQDNIPKKTLTIYYVLVDAPDLPPVHLQEVLDRVASWGTLPPTKIPSRLELLFSTAVAGKGEEDQAIFTNLTSDDLQLIPEDSHVGCGFVPRRYIERFLGRHRRGSRTFCLQVRIVSAQYGVFKGMLMEKPGIEKIQLPPSMQKVAPPQISSTSCWILINNTYPSNVHLQVSKLLNGEKACKSFRPNKLKWMITSLFESLGVDKEFLQDYVDKSSRLEDLQHSSIVGVADPTNAIPPSHVFVTGTQGTDADLPHLFITRFPCSHQRDGLLLPNVSQKPEFMTTSDWSFLCNLPFGAVVFGNALPEEPSLPSQCSNGDLDGDHYFCCWNDKLIRQLQPVEPAKGEYDDGVMAVVPHNPQWLSEAQATIADVPRHSNVFCLIGKLCVAQKRLVQGCGPDCLDAHALGQAYKDALEVAKHGKKVRLPRHLWDILPVEVHHMLVDIGHCHGPCRFSDDPSRHKKARKRSSRTQKATASTRPTTAGAASNRESTSSSNDDLAGLQEGAPVLIVGGTHKSKPATFVRLTAKMVYLKLQEKPPKEIRISQASVRRA